MFMKNLNLDRRIKYTRKMIRQSFLQLLEEKPLGKITVKEICEKADINRATFYVHYEDVYDLLNKIEEEFYQEVLLSVSNMEQGNYTGILPLEILKKIRENEELCKAMFSKYGDKEFLARMMYFARADSLNAWRKLYPDMEEKRLEWLYEFIVNGCEGIIRSWAVNGFLAEPEAIAEFMAQMFRSCVQGMEMGAKGSDPSVRGV